MKNLLFFCLLFPCFIYAQSAKTPKHINMPGTRLFIIPPDSFNLEKQMGMALGKPDGSLMMVVENNKDKYSKETETRKKENLELQQVEIFENKEVSVSDFPGTLLGVQQDENLRYILFTFGDSTFLTTITSVYSPKNTKTEKDILESFKTIYFDKNYIPDPFGQAIYKLDLSDSKYKLQDQMGLMLTFTPGAKKLNMPQFIILQKALADTLTIEQNLQQFTEESLEGRSIPKIIKTNAIKIDGHDGHEFEMAGIAKEGAYIDIYSAVIKKDEMGVFVIGFCDQGDVGSMSEFKKFAGAIKIKH